MGKGPVTIGWVPPPAFAEALEPLPEPEGIYASHMCIDDASRPIKRWGNWNVEFQIHRSVRACTCERTPRYSKLFRTPYSHTIHFGNCMKNTESALLARQFASDKFPELEHAMLYAFFVRSDWLNRRHLVLNSLDSLDYSWETFIKETHPKKRRIYQAGKDMFLQSGRVVTRLMMFSKTNEVHHTDEPGDPRPRCLFDPHETLKAVGAYCARLMISCLKKGYPEFISGMNMTQLSAYISERLSSEQVDLGSDKFYSYDGSGHDSHQSMEFIECVDHMITRDLLPHILARSWIPDVLHAEVLNCATQTVWSAYTIYGSSFKMVGTVFSGHPFRTTLFNTIRTIYYNLYCAWLAGCKDHVVFAAGDDVFGHQPDQAFYNVLQNLLSPCKFGISGLGQVAKDLARGGLNKHTFLSKRLYLFQDELVVDREPAKLIVSGCVSDKLENLTVPEFCTMQYLQLSDVTDDYGALRRRFAYYGLRPVNSRMADILQYDWGYKLHLAQHPKPEARHPDDPHAPPYHSPLEGMHGGVARAGWVINCPLDSVVSKIGGISFLRGRRLENLTFMARKRQQRQRRGANRRVRQNAQRGRARNRNNNIVGYRGNQAMAAYRPRNYPEPAGIAQQQVSLRTRLGAYSSMPLAVSAYLGSLLNPWGGARSKIPGAGGGATSTVSIRQVVAFTTNALGFARIQFTPWNPNAILRLYNDATCTEVLAGPSVTLIDISQAPNNLAAYFRSYRIVSAGLQILSTAPLLNNGGMVSLTRFPSVDMVAASDTIRDHISTRYFRPSDTSEIVYWPKAADSVDMVNSAAGEPGQPTNLVACFSGCSANQPMIARIVANYEFIPAPGFTDAYPPSATPLGDPYKVIFEYEPPAARKAALIGGIGVSSKGHDFISYGRFSKGERRLLQVMKSLTQDRPITKVSKYAPGYDRTRLNPNRPLYQGAFTRDEALRGVRQGANQLVAMQEQALALRNDDRHRINNLQRDAEANRQPGVLVPPAGPPALVDPRGGVRYVGNADGRLVPAMNADDARDAEVAVRFGRALPVAFASEPDLEVQVARMFNDIGVPWRPNRVVNQAGLHRWAETVDRLTPYLLQHEIDLGTSRNLTYVALYGGNVGRADVAERLYNLEDFPDYLEG